MSDPIDRLRERVTETLGDSVVEKIRGRLGELLGAIDIVGLTLTGFAGLIRGFYAPDGIGTGLSLIVAFLSFALIAYLRR